MIIVEWKQNNFNKRKKKYITNGFVYYTLKPEIEMWSKTKKTHSDDNIMQEKNVKKHMHTYILWNQLWMCATLDEW